MRGKSLCLARTYQKSYNIHAQAVACSPLHDLLRVPCHDPCFIIHSNKAGRPTISFKLEDPFGQLRDLHGPWNLGRLKACKTLLQDTVSHLLTGSIQSWWFVDLHLFVLTSGDPSAIGGLRAVISKFFRLNLTKLHNGLKSDLTNKGPDSSCLLHAAADTAVSSTLLRESAPFRSEMSEASPCNKNVSHLDNLINYSLKSGAYVCAFTCCKQLEKDFKVTSVISFKPTVLKKFHWKDSMIILGSYFSQKEDISGKFTLS